jgi:hypothetical protein
MDLPCLLVRTFEICRKLGYKAVMNGLIIVLAHLGLAFHGGRSMRNFLLLHSQIAMRAQFFHRPRRLLGYFFS